MFFLVLCIVNVVHGFLFVLNIIGCIDLHHAKLNYLASFLKLFLLRQSSSVLWIILLDSFLLNHVRIISFCYHLKEDILSNIKKTVGANSTQPSLFNHYTC